MRMLKYHCLMLTMIKSSIFMIVAVGEKSMAWDTHTE